MNRTESIAESPLLGLAGGRHGAVARRTQAVVRTMMKEAGVPGVSIAEAGMSDGKVIPRLEFRGDFLHAFLDTARVKSHKPVTLIRGADKFTADSLDYDSVTGVAHLQGRVHGVLMPRPAGPGEKR